MQETTKVCRKCNEVKPLTDYYKQKSGDDYYVNGLCKVCWKLRNKLREAALSFEELERRKLYKQEYNKQYVQQRKEELYAYGKVYRANNKERINNHAAEYRRANRAALLERTKKYYIENKKKVNRKNTERNAKRVRADINYRIKRLLHKRIRGSVKLALGIRKDKSVALLGCTITEFRSYFEAKFTDGMTWDKFMLGEIHIDHIVPCASFDLSDISQQKQCFHFTNLQPLWAVDNLVKGSKIGLAVATGGFAPNPPERVRGVDFR